LPAQALVVAAAEKASAAAPVPSRRRMVTRLAMDMRFPSWRRKTRSTATGQRAAAGPYRGV